MANDNGNAKKKALNLAVKQIKREHGKGSIMRLGDEPDYKVEAIPTGSLALDQALGVGGVPRGRIIEIYGPESSGKTTLATHIIAEAQDLGGTCAFIDAEHAFDPNYAEDLGVDTDDLLVSQPDTGEQALNICDTLVRSGALDVIVIDSVAALVPEAELEGDMGDTHVGLQARLMSQALRKLAGTINRTKTALIFINQIRMKIGVMFGCFQYNTRVRLADGRSKKIGTIVNQKLPVEVMSYNPETGAIEPRKVVDWHKNGTADYFLQFEVEGGSSRRRNFAATPNHLILTPDGEVHAGELDVGDQVLARVSEEDGSHSEASGDGTSDAVPDFVNGTTMTATLPRTEKAKAVQSYGRVVPATIRDVYVQPPTQSMQRFDLEVEGNHTYLVDDVVVHNSPETTSGGRALKFYCSVRMDIRRIGAVKDGTDVVGNRTRVKVKKNKVAPPFREAEFDIIYGEGISAPGELIDLGVEFDILQKRGSWYSYGEETIAQGRAATKEWLEENDEERETIKQAIRREMGIIEGPEDDADETDAEEEEAEA